MADIYLAPADVNATDTEKVLAFLNSAASAKEIASVIEISNELDIGLKLGARILNTRVQLGGSFKNLQQLMHVPLIGPERFTEIISVITGKTPLHVITGHPDMALSDLSNRYNSLRSLLSELEESEQHRYQIRIEPLSNHHYVGEVIPFKIVIYDRLQRVNKANMPLTIETNWGYLQSTKGYQQHQGAVIRVHSGVDGTVQCELRTATTEALTLAQQVDLERGLDKLPNTALVPDQAREGFQWIVQNYQHPLNDDFRSAVDIHYLSREKRLVGTLNQPASLYQWQHEHALIRVYVHPEAGDNPANILSVAAYTVELRDWLPPMFQVYKDGLLEQSGLSDGIQSALQYSEDESGIASHLVSNIRTFVSQQNGRIGEKASLLAGEEIISQLTATGFETLSPRTQTTLYTLMQAVPSNLTAANSGNIALASEVAVDVGRQAGFLNANSVLDAVNQELSAIQNTVDNMTSRVNGIETQLQDVNFAQLSDDLESFSSDYTQFQTDYADFSRRRTSFDTQVTNLNETVVDFNQAANQLISNVTDGVNAALQNIGSTGDTNVTIQPIETITLRGNITGPGPGGGG